MELTKEYRLDMLNANSVSVITTSYINTDSGKLQVGNPLVCCYANCPCQREKLQQVLPEEYVNAILLIWGENATLPDPVKPAILE